MKNYKICVYCICKNESKFVDRFMDALDEIKEHVYVLDTGSTDNTVELFKKRNAHVFEKKYEHFMFDVARNDALNLVPHDYDICISLDIDDVIQRGFVDVINNIWDEDINQLEYTYYYTMDEYDNPLVIQKINKIHSRDGFYWEYPVHEVLRCSGNNNKSKYTDKILVIHRPDIYKSRDFYFDLLEERVEKYPDDARNIFLLAREYKRYGKNFEGIKMCHRYLALCTTYSSEKTKVECLLAHMFRELQMYEESELWADKAIEERKDTRSPYYEKVLTYYASKRYEDLIKAGEEALKIDTYNADIIDEAGCWDGSIPDYMSLAYYYIKDYSNAIKYVNMTIEQNPNNERLKKNRELYISAMKQQD